MRHSTDEAHEEHGPVNQLAVPPLDLGVEGLLAALRAQAFQDQPQVLGVRLGAEGLALREQGWPKVRGLEEKAGAGRDDPHRHRKSEAPPEPQELLEALHRFQP